MQRGNTQVLWLIYLTVQVSLFNRLQPSNCWHISRTRGVIKRIKNFLHDPAIARPHSHYTQRHRAWMHAMRWQTRQFVRIFFLSKQQYNYRPRGSSQRRRAWNRGDGRRTCCMLNVRCRSSLIYYKLGGEAPRTLNVFPEAHSPSYKHSGYNVCAWMLLYARFGRSCAKMFLYGDCICVITRSNQCIWPVSSTVYNQNGVYVHRGSRNSVFGGFRSHQWLK